MIVVFAIALCIVWLGFICVPAINGIQMFIRGFNRILDASSYLPEYRTSEIFIGIGTILYSVFLMSLSVILALFPFFNQF